MNLLANASSPYLRQHASNPVHWRPWGEEAFAAAIQSETPVFLSVGYSSCHWCHVMEHESFEDQGIAKLLNNHFVSIKVDREERPDVDEAYMLAVQLATGRGGWPMSVFLTPDRKPFFAGTYFPREDRGAHRGFRSILEGIASAWRDGRGEIEQAANEFALALERHRSTEPTGSGLLDESVVSKTLVALAETFDSENGGFGTRPKFPPHSALRLLLAMPDEPVAKRILHKTLDGLLRGGIHDHVGGGFHRYSTDENWVLPHFEKMLYDNALLLRCFALAGKQFDSASYLRVADRIAQWLLREMRSEDGLFYSALDADTEGEEGLFYTWAEDEIDQVLGNSSGDFKNAFNVAQEGNYLDEMTRSRTGRNVLHTSTDRLEQFDGDLEILRQVRESRPRPALDDKSVVAWNGLAIGALAASGHVDAATRAANEILKQGYPFPHQIVGRVAEGRAFVDLAYFVEGLLDLSDATEDLSWATRAEEVYDQMIPEFRAPYGGWHFSGSNHESLFGNHRPCLDTATPSPNGILVLCAVRLGRLDLAAEDLRSLMGWVEHAPHATESVVLAAKRYFEVGGQPLTRPTATVRTTPAVLSSGDTAAHFTIHMEAPAGWSISIDQGSSRSPLAVSVSGLGNPVATFEGRDGGLDIQISGEPPDSATGEARAVVQFQLCTETECLLPEERDVLLQWRRLG